MTLNLVSVGAAAGDASPREDAHGERRWLASTLWWGVRKEANTSECLCAKVKIDGALLSALWKHGLFFVNTHGDAVAWPVHMAAVCVLINKHIGRLPLGIRAQDRFQQWL